MGLRQRTLSEWRKIFSISIFSDGYQISKCKVDQPVVIIPGEIDGKPVRSIAKGAFSRKRNIEQIQIPDEVKIIGDDAFYFFCNSFTIHAPAGSYAEQYAKENNIPFVAE